MEDDSRLWRLWQGCFERFRLAFTEPGFRRFVEYLTGLALDPEEHTVTQALTSLGRERDWAALERFLERGRWQTSHLEASAWRAVAETFPETWHGYRVIAVDDTKVHRSSRKVWGTCTFHEYTARCPNRAGTVRAHNWVVAGSLVPGRPWQCLPAAGRLYFREGQVPRGERFVRKTAHAVDLLERAAGTLRSDLLGVFDGAYAMSTVVQPLLDREPVGGRIDFVSRIRANARLYEVPPARRCLWHSAGPTRPVTVVIAEVAGYKRRWYLVTSSERLTGLEVVEVFAARFRQEDSFRDLKQRLGAEECRAWTKGPILRTFQAQMIGLTALRLLAKRLDEERGEGQWWSRQPWYRWKRKPSVRDVIRLLRRSVWGFGQVGPPDATWSKPTRPRRGPLSQPRRASPPRRKAA